MERFYQTLTSLLPQGYAWPRDQSSVWMRVMRAIAGGFGELHAFILQSVNQWFPHTTFNRLDEWEAAVGLPDACFGAVTDPIRRRELMLLRLRGVNLPCPDSSAASPEVIKQLCENYGYVVNVFYNAPMRVYSAACPGDVSSVGKRLGSAGRLYVDMSSYCSPMRVSARVGSRLIECSKPPEALLCLLQDFVPARFQIVVIIDGALVAT